jgi:CRP/FNR family cyclic AMP-dependent transcriptional regulator
VAITDVVEHLGSVPIFEGCSKKDLQTIARQVREITHEAGYVIATEGDPGAGLFVIAEGEADVTIGGKRVNHLKAGDFFGEMALLDDEPRSATVAALNPLSTLSIAAFNFRSLLKSNASITYKVLVSLCQRVRAAERSRF